MLKLNIFKSRDRVQLEDILYVREIQLKDTLIRLAYMEKFEADRLDPKVQGDFREQMAEAKKQGAKASGLTPDEIEYKISECKASVKIHDQLTSEIVEHTRMIRLVKKQLRGEINIIYPGRPDYFRNKVGGGGGGEGKNTASSK